MVSTKIKLIASTCTVDLLAFATGNSYAWSSTVLMALESDDPARNPIGHKVTAFEESWIASLVSLGATCGPVLAGCCSEKFGRKRTLLAFAMPMFLSQLILAFANTTIEFYVARFMLGLGVGCVYTVIPIYVGEIAITEIRGLLGCFLSVFYSAGLLFVYAIGPFVNLRTLSYILMVPIGLFIFLFGCFVPESPYYFVAIGNDADAATCLSKLRTHDYCAVLKELAEIKRAEEELKDNKLSIYDSFKTRSFRKGLIITTVLMVSQQFVGRIAILSYMEDIFISSESSISSTASTIIVAAIQMCFAILSSCLVDKWGRKPLLILAIAGNALSLFSLGIYFYMKDTEMDVKSLWWLPVASLIIFVITYTFGLGSIPWALVGELFSSQTKSLASTISAITSLSLAFIMTLIFPTLKDLLGYHGMFWFFGSSAIACWFFVICYVPETKGKSFQEIQRILDQSNTVKS